MKKQERQVILTIEPAHAAEVILVMKWANEILLAGSLYIATIPTYTDPQVSGRRTAERQLAYIHDGKSWWNPANVENAPHVRGVAIHLGLRYRTTGRYIPWGRMSKEARQVFLISKVVNISRRYRFGAPIGVRRYPFA